MMSSQPYVLVIDEYSIIAQGCQLRFAQAGLPWTVRWVPSLHTADGQLVPELGAADGHPAPDLAILELRLADGSTPTDNIRELSKRSIPVSSTPRAMSRYWSARPLPPTFWPL